MKEANVQASQPSEDDRHPLKAHWSPRIRWNAGNLFLTAVGVTNGGVGVASVVMAAFYYQSCLAHPAVPLWLALHGIAQVEATGALAVYADVAATLRHNLRQAWLQRLGKRKTKLSYLMKKEKRIYRSLSVDNLREKTGKLIPLEEEVRNKRSAWFFIVCKIFTAVSLVLLLPLTTVGTMVVHSVWSQPRELVSCDPALLLFCQVLSFTYDILYLGIFMFLFCVNSCSPVFVKDNQVMNSNSKLPPKYHQFKGRRMSPGFQDDYKAPPGWSWLSFVGVVIGGCYGVLAIPVITIGSCYVEHCSQHPKISIWLITQGAASVTFLVAMIPGCCWWRRPKVSTRTLALLFIPPAAVAVFLFMWPAIGSPWVVSAWRERSAIATGSSGTCDNDFLLFAFITIVMCAIPLMALAYAVFLMGIATAIFVLGILCYWCCCDDGITSDAGVIGITYATDTNNTLSGIFFGSAHDGVASNSLGAGNSLTKKNLCTDQHKVCTGVSESSGKGNSHGRSRLAKILQKIKN